MEPDVMEGGSSIEGNSICTSVSAVDNKGWRAYKSLIFSQKNCHASVDFADGE